MVSVRLAPMDSKMYLGKARVVAGDPWTPRLGPGCPLKPPSGPLCPHPKEPYLLWSRRGPLEHSQWEEGDREKMNRERAGKKER